VALSIGELVGYVDLDASAAEKSAGGIGSMLENLGGQWGKVLGAVGAGGALAFGAGLVAGMDAEVGSDMLAASLGGGEKMAARYGDIAGKVYSDGFGAGLEDVNAAMGAVVTSIKGMRGASDKEVQRMTEKAMTYADVIGIDVTRAAQVAGNMVNNGLAKNGGQAFDLLMKASQKVPVQLREDVLDATDEYGQFFTQVGIDGPKAMGMLAAGAAKGMYGIDKTGDAIKEFTIRATDMSTSTKGAYEAVGLDAKKMTDDLLAGGDRGSKAFDKVVGGLLKIENPAKRANTAIALFGTPLEDIGVKDIPAFLQSMQNGEKGLGKFAGSVDKAGQTAYDNASSNLSMFTRTLKTGFVELIGGSVLPKVNELTGSLATGLGPAVSAVTDFLSEHSNVVKPIVAVLAGLAGGALLVVGAIKAWTIVQGILNTVMAMNPIGLVVIAIAGLAAGLVYAYKKSETFRNIVDGAMSAVRDAAAATFGWFKRKWPLLLAIITGPIGLAVYAVVKNWDKIKSASSTAWNAIKGAVTGALDNVQGAISGLSAIPGKVADWFGRAKQSASDKLGDMVAYVKGIPGKITSGLGDLGGLLKDAGQKVIQGLIDGITDKVADLRDKLQSVTKLIPDWKGPAETDKKLLRKNGQLIMQGLMDGIEDGTGGLKALLAQITDDLGKGKLAKVEKAVSAEYARGLRIARKRRKLAKELETARGALEDAIKLRDDLFDSVKSGALSFGSALTVDTGDEPLTGGVVVKHMQDRLAQVEKFRQDMAALLAQGLDKTTYLEMIEKGVEGAGAMAAVLVQDPAAVTAIAGLSSQLQTAADGLAADASTSMYQAGVDTAQAVVDGLELDEAALQTKAQKIAEQIRKALADALGVAIDDATGAGGDGGKGKGGKGKGKDRDKDRDKSRNGREAPMIGTVIQRPNESADELAERLWFKTRTRG